VNQYILECRNLGFDIIEISCGFITIPMDDWLRLVEKVKSSGLAAKPEVGIQFGAGGATAAEELEAEGTRDPEWAINQMKRLIDAGAGMIMVEWEGITENVKRWRSDVTARFVEAIGLEHLMFEAADPEVFAWYVKNYGPGVNLFVDHSQIVQLECLRSGIWGTKSTWDEYGRLQNSGYSWPGVSSSGTFSRANSFYNRLPLRGDWFSQQLDDSERLCGAG